LHRASRQPQGSREKRKKKKKKRRKMKSKFGVLKGKAGGRTHAPVRRGAKPEADADADAGLPRS